MSARPRFVAHVGLQQGEGGALRDWLAANRPAISAAGLHVPLVGEREGRSHRRLAEALVDAPEGARAAAFRAALPPAASVVISSEWLSAADVAGRAARLAAAVDSSGLAKHAVVVVRETEEATAAAFVRRRASLQHGGESYARFAADLRASGALDAVAVVRGYCAAGFAVDVVDFHAVRERGVVAAVLASPAFRGQLDALLPTAAPEPARLPGVYALLVADRVRRAADRDGVRLTPGGRRQLVAAIAQAAARLPYLPFDPEIAPTGINDAPAALRGSIRAAADAVIDRARARGWYARRARDSSPHMRVKLAAEQAGA